MYSTGAHEDSREEQEMPPLVDADEDMQEVTLTPTTVPASTAELPIQRTALSATTSTIADTRESMIRTGDQLITETEITEPRLSTREERATDQPLSSTTVTTAQVSPLPTVTTRPEASDLIWPGHQDAQARGLFPPTDGEEIGYG